MANYSTDDDLKVLSEFDLFSTISKSDSSSVNDDNSSWKYLLTKKISLKDNYYKNLPGAMPISMTQMITAQNTNAPWLFNILKKKFHHSRKDKNDPTSILLEKPISTDGTSGKWIVNEKDIGFPLIKDFDMTTSGQFNVSRAMSSSTLPIPLSTNDSLHVRHYHYDFQTLNTPTTSLSSFLIEETKQKISNDEDTPVDLTSIASMVKTYYTTSRQQTEMSSLPSALEPLIEDIYLTNGNSTITKRAKSASASRSRRTVNSSPTKRGKGRSESTKKKKSKYYQEHILSPEEIQLREALRIIDLDNIGFFPPNEFHKVLKDIGINSNDIERIERCLPLDEDGHYSIDNLIKLFLGTK